VERLAARRVQPVCAGWDGTIKRRPNNKHKNKNNKQYDNDKRNTKSLHREGQG